MILKVTSLLLCSCLLALRLMAQQTAHVLHVSGQVEYYAQHAAKPVLLSPGMELDMKGKVRCKGTASAKLLSNGRTIVVSGSKMRDLQALAATNAGESNAGFTGRFLNFVEESVQESDSEEKLKKQHRKYMNKASGGVKGYANQANAITPLLLASGKLPLALVTFQWRKAAGDGPYTFSLLVPGGKPVVQLLVLDTAITLDLKQLALNPDEGYEWSITRGSTAKSAAMPVEISPQSMEAAQNSISRVPYYSSALPFERQLMLAYTYEEDNCYYGANQVYAALLSAEPNNPLLRRLYAAFLARMDMLPEAIALVPSGN
ncbi:MAG: hypothetical protein ABIQ93_03080 [Saprospiraceae bacterium]